MLTNTHDSFGRVMTALPRGARVLVVGPHKELAHRVAEGLAMACAEPDRARVMRLANPDHSWHDDMAKRHRNEAGVPLTVAVAGTAPARARAKFVAILLVKAAPDADGYAVWVIDKAPDDAYPLPPDGPKTTVRG